MKYRKKMVIVTGYTCNNNCRFCCDGNKRHLKNLSLEQIKKTLEEARSKGFDYIHFLGGETTIRKDVFDMVSHAKKLNYKIIQITTNGRMFYYKEFAEKMVECGLNEAIFSIHGHNAKLHDLITRSEGSFKQLITGIKNLKKLGVYIHANVTIVKQNYKYLEDIARNLVKLNIRSAEFIFVDPSGNALNDFDRIVPTYKEVEPFLHKAIEIGIKNKCNHWVSRYYPFCFMKGYEKHISELNEPHMEYVSPDIVDENVAETRKNARIKSEKCKQCKYELLCEGPWKECVNRRGWDEFKPVKGKK